MQHTTRNITALAVSQGLMVSAMSLVVTTSALVGFRLAPEPSLATLPVAVQLLATMLTTIPAALLMGRIGRKPGFLLASLFGLSGAALATFAILHEHFWQFVGASALLGMFNGFGSYFRFAAAAAADEAHKSRAISYVMAGGVAAAVVGPNLANWTRDSIEGAAFAGSYASLLVVYSLALVALSTLRLPREEGPRGAAGRADTRPLPTIAAQPKFLVALLCATLGYAVMTLVMTTTPLAMQDHAHPFGEISFVIQWHVLGMFAPSFVTGHLIRRFGVIPILTVGALLELLCVAINLSGAGVLNFWAALLLLGVGWNFLFVGGTMLLTETYVAAERFKVQALNDFTVFTAVTIASLSAGALHIHLGWEAVNLGVLPLLALVLLGIAWLSAVDRREAPAAASRSEA